MTKNDSFKGTLDAIIKLTDKVKNNNTKKVKLKSFVSSIEKWYTIMKAIIEEIRLISIDAI